MIPNATLIAQQSIAIRAYYLWEAEGRPMGRHEAHWLAAEVTEKRSSAARRAAATRRANQEAARKVAVSETPKILAKTNSKTAETAAPEVVVAAAAVTKTRSASARTSRRVH